VVGDLSPGQLQLNRENAQSQGYANAIESWVECELCDLQPHFADAGFDAVVCYGGPLSYVFNQRDQAITELLRVTRPGGLLFIGVMSLWGTIHHYLPGILKADPALNREIVATGDLGPDKAAVSTHFCHMFRAAELRECLERDGAIVEVLSASDCLAATWVEALKEVQNDAATWQHLLEMEIEACRQPGCWDMGAHLIAVSRKAG
jgi:SAM-dependent methyltransferase